MSKRLHKKDAIKLFPLYTFNSHKLRPPSTSTRAIMTSKKEKPHGTSSQHRPNGHQTHRLLSQQGEKYSRRLPAHRRRIQRRSSAHNGRTIDLTRSGA